MGILREFVADLIREGFLNEIRVESVLDDETDEYSFIYYKGWLMKYEGGFDEVPWEEFQILTGLSDEEMEILEHDYEMLNTNIFSGKVDGDTLIPFSKYITSHSPRSSDLVKKIMKTLGLKYVDYHYSDYDDTDEDFSDSSMLEFWQLLEDGVWWHGTNSNALFGKGGIAKKGLVPGGSIGKTNWGELGVSHDKVVSLAKDPEIVFFHARNSTSKGNGFPVILGFELPDPDKVIADYDMDRETTDSLEVFDDVRTAHDASREERHKKDNWAPKKPMDPKDSRKTSLDVGIIGYLGRIPANFIVDARYWSLAHQQWVRTDLSELKHMWEMSEQYGLEAYESDPEDFEEDEDEIARQEEERKEYERIVQKAERMANA